MAPIPVNVHQVSVDCTVKKKDSAPVHPVHVGMVEPAKRLPEELTSAPVCIDSLARTVRQVNRTLAPPAPARTVAPASITLENTSVSVPEDSQDGTAIQRWTAEFPVK